MKTVKIKIQDIRSVFIFNWKCPNCGNDNEDESYSFSDIIGEFGNSYDALCNGCGENVKVNAD